MVAILMLWIMQLVPLNPAPRWSYYDDKARGISLADFNNDGWLDLSVAREAYPNYIFMNKHGILDTFPVWQSADFDPSVWCAWADYDNDSDLDLVIANCQFLGGRLKLYKNEAGSISTSPVWVGSKGGCWAGWADVDNDGDLDLAAIDMLQYPCVFYNNNGVLESNPSWQANDHDIDFSGGAWADINNDGWLDLVVGNINWAKPMLRVYYNHNGTLETTASWTSETPQILPVGGVSVADVNNDGWLDVACGNGAGAAMEDAPNFIFMNTGGTLETSPSWVSADVYNSIGVAFGDVDGDGYMDLACANIGRAACVYANNNGSLIAWPDWFSNVSGIHNVAWGDVDNDGLVASIDTFTVDGTKKLFYLSHYPVHKLQVIKVNNDTVPISDYCYDLVAGWFTLKNMPDSGNILTVEYTYSIDMELALSGNYLFENTNMGIEEVQSSKLEVQSVKLEVYPNPFSRKTEIRIQSIDYRLQSTDYRLTIYDLTGRLVKSFGSGDPKLPELNPDKIGMNPITVVWDGRDESGKLLPSGVYFCKLQVGNRSLTKQLLLME
ncbi:MAG: FG-GAP-like repeat-containing protein [bacterium]|nr:FG-GAP-like repeat-containing protein [bacterium]